MFISVTNVAKCRSSLRRCTLDHVRKLSVVPIGLNKKRPFYLRRRRTDTEDAESIHAKDLEIDIPELYFDHTGEASSVSKFLNADPLKLLEQQRERYKWYKFIMHFPVFTCENIDKRLIRRVKSRIYSLKDLSKLENIEDKYKLLEDEFLEEMEANFVKTFQAFIEKDYKTLGKITTYQYFTKRKKERELLAEYGKLTWTLKRIIPKSVLVTVWSNDKFDPLVLNSQKDFYALVRVTFEHSMSWEEAKGRTVIGNKNHFVVEPHFIVFKLSTSVQHEKWRVHAQVTRIPVDKDEQKLQENIHST